MRHQILFAAIFSSISLTAALPSNLPDTLSTRDANISLPLFAELEEFSRIVDISYCVGTTGISKPFQCASRCDDFPAFELIDTFNTGPLMSDSCGYMVLDHGVSGKGSKGRIIIAFRGTYSIANTIIDLSTVPQEYVPYPGNGGNDTTVEKEKSSWSIWRSADLAEKFKDGSRKEEIRCDDCTVHSGFWTSWQNTRDFVLPHIREARKKYPNYKLHLVGHSLGGAVSALAGLEFDALGWEPTVTTFGEPKVGNTGLRTFIDKRFGLPYGDNKKEEQTAVHGGRYRRLTHVDDPVPLLPLHEWGYRPHAGEVFISKSSLQPSPLDVHHCYGDEDLNCIAGAEVEQSWLYDLFASSHSQTSLDEENTPSQQEEEINNLQRRWGIHIPSRYKMWQLFFAHRDYFWRLGLCVSGSDPSDWGRDKYKFPRNGDQVGRGEL